MRVEFNKYTKSIIQILEDNQTFISVPPDHTVIQGDKDEILKVGTIIGLDISQIDETMTEEAKRVYKDRAFGNKIINQFLEENKRVTMSAQESLGMLQFFLMPKMLLELGDIKGAKSLLENTSADGFAVCPPYSTKEERRNVYLAYLTNYLNEPNT